MKVVRIPVLTGVLTFFGLTAVRVESIFPGVFPHWIKRFMTSEKRSKRSKYKGICLLRNGWQVRRCFPGSGRFCGKIFDSEKEAALASDQALRDRDAYHMDFNFPRKVILSRVKNHS